jgi:tripartite-type tricarboxylate transporter receptor subunit TctC
MKKFKVVLLTAAILLVAGAVYAQDYPTRPIRMIIPFGPGGASDFVGRILQPKLHEALGQPVLADNRPGADGEIGLEVVAGSAPDGYTLLLANVQIIAINPNLNSKSKINPLQDLIGITEVVDVPGALAIHSSIPATTVADFIAYTKTRPGQLNYGSAGVSSPSTLAFEFLKTKAGINIKPIHYKGGAGAATIALLSREVTVALGTVASFVPHLKSGKLKVIGIMAKNRIASLPDTPTLAESGFPELTTGSWQGVYVPAGTPKPIVAKLYSALRKVMNDPWVIERLATAGAEAITSKSPEDFTVFMKSQNEFWAQIIKQLDIVKN